MEIDDVIRLIESGNENNVESIKFDTLEIKFKNKSTADSICGKPNQESEEPDFDPLKIENDEEVESNEVNYEESLLKAQALNLLALENPDEFEELIANDEEALQRLEKAIMGGD